MGAGLVGAWLVALCVYDVRQHRLPNTLTLPGAAAIVTGAVLAGHGAGAFAGAGALAGVYLAVHLVDPAAMGAGDVKLALGLGGLTGAFGLPVWVLAALAAPLLTGLLGLTAMWRGTGTAVPHGPSMCVATAASVALVFV